MKHFNKTLSVILAVVMVLSTMSMIAFAHTSTWAEDPNTVNLKYEVTQVPSVTMKDGTGTYTAVDNDIYAVTVFAKTPALTGILYLQVPFQYDVRYFEPVMTMDAGDLYCAYDGWYTDIGITDVCISLPERYTDTKSYDKDGNEVSALKGVCTGLGKVAGGLTDSTYYYGKDDPVSTNMKAYEGLDENLRVCALTLDGGSLKAKAAYLNAVNGLIPTDWVEMGTMYFHRVAGVSEADAIGQTIGISDGANFGTQLSTRTTTAAQPAGYLTAHTNPGYAANYAANAVVAAPAVTGPVVAKKAAQVKFTADETQPDGVADAFQLRIKSEITAKDWDDYFANTTAEGATTNMITAVGMVAYPTPADNSTAYDKALATEAANKAIRNPEYTAVAGEYKAASTTYIQKESATSNAYFGAIINTTHERCKDVDINYIGFVQYKDSNGDPQIIFYDAACIATVASNYETHVHNFEIKNWSQA